MRSKKALFNVLTNIVLQVLVALSGLILPRFFLEAYGSTINGMISSVGQFMAYLALVEAGISAAAMVGLYIPLAHNNNNEINAIMAATRNFYNRSGIVYVFLVTLMAIIYPIGINGQVSIELTRAMIILLAGSNIIDYFFTGKYRVLLTADQKGYVVTGVQAMGVVVNIVVTVILVKHGMNILIVKLIATIIYALRSVIIYIYVKKQYSFLDFRVKPNIKPLDQRWSALIHQIAGVVVNNTDIIIITFCLGADSLKEASVYAIYQMVAYAVTLLANTFANGLGAAFGDIISKKQEDTLRRVFSNFEYLYQIFLFTCYTCMGILLLPFVRIYTIGIQDANYIRMDVAFLFTLVGLIQNIRIPALTIICAAGHFKQTQGRAIIEATLNLVISLVLVQKFGMVGVLFGTLCSYLYRSIDVIIYNAHHFVTSSIRTTIFRTVRNMIAMFILVYLSGFQDLFSINGYISWFISAIIWGGMSLLFISLVNAVAEPLQFKQLLERMKSLLRKS